MNDTTLLTRSTDAPVVDVDVAARRVTVRLCRWNEPRDVTDPDGRRYRETYPPGSVELADDVHVVDRHHGTLIGRADPASLVDDDTGPTVELSIARTAAGDDTLALIDAGVIRSVSMELEPVTEDVAGDTITRTRSRVHGVAFAFRPSHDAPILAVREPTPNGATVTTTTTTTDDTPTVLTRADLDAVAEGLVARGDLDGMLDELRRDIAGLPDTLNRGAHPLAGYRTLVDYADAVFAGDADSTLLARALVDQITTNNPGVIPPAWVRDVKGIIDPGRPVATAFGVTGLPSSGMDVNWPYFDGDLLALVARQTTEKTPITSVRVDLKRGTTDIRTYAGGSDISYQLIRRSDPAYRDAYLRIMNAAYAAVTDGVAATMATATATPSAATWDSTDGLVALATALFTASAEVQAATGSPATFALAATDVFIAAGGLSVAAASPYGTNNVPGTGSAATLEVSVAGLRLIHAPMLTDGTLLVSNGTAADWHEDGPFTVTAEDVEKLGQNVAVWGMGAWSTYIAGGIRSIATTVPVVALAAPAPPVDEAVDDTETEAAAKTSKASK